MRPDYPTVVYTKILRELFPDTPIITGGIEPSLRRLSHYDYWQDRLRPSILLDAPADILIYGMGEKPVVEIARRISAGEKVSEITDVPQTALLRTLDKMPENPDPAKDIILNSWEDALRDPGLQSANFKHIEQQSNRLNPDTRLWQAYRKDGVAVQINPMLPAMTRGEIDTSFDLP